MSHGGQTRGGEAFGAPDLRVSQKGLTNPILPPAERPLSGKSRSEVSLLGRKEREGLELPFTVVFGSLIILPIVKCESQRAIKGNLVSPFIFSNGGKWCLFLTPAFSLESPLESNSFPWSGGFLHSKSTTLPITCQFLFRVFSAGTSWQRQFGVKL